MKRIKCYDCDDQFEGEEPMDVLNKMHMHYMEKHHLIITRSGKAEKKRWLAQFTKDWDATPDL